MIILVLVRFVKKDISLILLTYVKFVFILAKDVKAIITTVLNVYQVLIEELLIPVLVILDMLTMEQLVNVKMI